MHYPAFLLDLRDWGVLRLTGPDAREFLQGVGTQEVATMEPGSAQPTFFLTDKGRPVALAWAAPDPDGSAFTLFVEPGGRDALEPHLDRLRIMEDVVFEAPSPAPRLVGVAGVEHAHAAREWARPVAKSQVMAAEPISFWLLPDNGSTALPVAPIAGDEAEFTRIALGIPRAGVDFDLDRLATELSYLEAISTTKGCFVGQEVVARTTHRGAVRRKRIGFRYDARAGVMPRGTKLRVGENDAGFITSTATEPHTNRGVGMGYLSADVPWDAVIHAQDTTIEVATWPL